MATLCAACLFEVKNKCELRCSRCNEYYHFQCVGYVADSYKRLDIDFKKKWICTSCNCKQRKPGNNSETPVRNNVHLSPPSQSDYDNVTLRAKPRETPNTSLSPHSHISEETLRSIIRQEVAHILGESLKKHVDGPIRELKNEIRSIHDSISILVKLSSPRLRDTLLASVIKYYQTHNQKKLQSCDLGIGGKTSCPIYVVENLSPENKELHAAARKRGKELGYKFVWIRGGKIFMRKDESANYTFVKNTDTLTRLT
ncbi:hypothetical protein ACJJTC_014049 [Scirpophaga incertulas]